MPRATGRKAPEVSEIRYLLFQICNVALLLLDQEPQDGARRQSDLGVGD